MKKALDISLLIGFVITIASLAVVQASQDRIPNDGFRVCFSCGIEATGGTIDSETRGYPLAYYVLRNVLPDDTQHPTIVINVFLLDWVMFSLPIFSAYILVQVFKKIRDM